jgi:hypothetical protein
MVTETIDDLGLENNKQEAKPRSNYENKVKTGIGSFFAREVDKPYYAAALTALSKGLVIHMHGTAHGPVPCKKSKVFTATPDKVVCETCLEPDSFNAKKKNEAKPALCLPMYFYDSVGNVIDIPKDDGTVIQVNDNPTKIAVLKAGTNNVNLTAFKEYDDEGELMAEIWELKRYPKEAKKAMVPAVAVKKKVEKQFQHIGGTTVPADVRDKFDSMTREEVRGLIVNIFAADPSNCIDWTNAHMLKYVVKPTAANAATDGEGTNLAAELDG